MGERAAAKMASSKSPLVQNGGPVVSKWMKLYPGGDEESPALGRRTNAVIDERPVPSPRSLHVVAAYKNYLYVFGGYNGSERVNDIYRFCLETYEWGVVTPVGGTVPPPRDRHCGCVYKDCLYVFGGFDGARRINDMWSFSFETSTWKEIDQNTPLANNNNNNIGDEEAVFPTVAPSPRHSHAAVVVGCRMYVFGGYDGEYKNDFYYYDLEKKAWYGVRPRGDVPEERYRTTLVRLGSEIVLHAGHNGLNQLIDCFVFSTV